MYILHTHTYIYTHIYFKGFLHFLQKLPDDEVIRMPGSCSECATVKCATNTQYSLLQKIKCHSGWIKQNKDPSQLLIAEMKRAQQSGTEFIIYHQ